MADNVCISATFHAHTTVDGSAAYVFHASAEADTEIQVGGCVGYAVSVSIGLTNDFSAAIAWQDQAFRGFPNGVPYGGGYYYVRDGQVWQGNEDLDSCVTPLGLGQYCIGGAAYAVASTTPLCMKATADVTVQGSLVAMGVGVPPSFLGPQGYSGYLGFASASFADATPECTIGSAPNSEPTPGLWTQLDEEGRNHLVGLARQAAGAGIDARFAGLDGTSQEREMHEALRLWLHARVHNLIGVEQLGLQAGPA